MTGKILALCVAAMGCGEDLDFSLDGDGGAYVDLYDDGAQLTIIGCAHGELFGCRQAAFVDTMSVTTDGQPRDVPKGESTVESLDETANLFHLGPFRLTVDSPADRRVDLELNGATASATLPPPFGARGPAGTVSRAAGPITIAYEPRADATATAVVSSSCNGARGFDVIPGTVAGEIAIDLTTSTSADAAACEHEIHVDQTVQVGNAELAVRAISIAVVTVTSQP